MARFTTFARTALAAGFALSLGFAATPSLAAEARDAKVVVSLKPGTVSATSAEIIVTANSVGEDTARGVSISLPYNSSQLSFVGAGARDADVAINSDSRAIELDIRSLGDGDTATATLRFNTQPGVSAVELRADYSWGDEGEEDNISDAVSNRLALRLADGPQPSLALSVAGSGAQVAVSSAGAFVPGEPLLVWATPTNSSSSVGFVFAEETVARVKSRIPEPRDEDERKDIKDWTPAASDGSVRYQLYASDLAPGEYTLVTYGHWSGIAATTVITVR
jgi:hypothetical protein